VALFLSGDAVEGAGQQAYDRARRQHADGRNHDDQVADDEEPFQRRS
jgi:hypothetical protein